MTNPIQNYIEQRKEEFDKKINEVRRETHWGEERESPIHDFGCKVQVKVDGQTELFTLTDWAHVKSFHTETITTVLKMVREVVEKDSDVRTSHAQSNFGRGFDYGYDVKRREMLKSLPDIT